MSVHEGICCRLCNLLYWQLTQTWFAEAQQLSKLLAMFQSCLATTLVIHRLSEA